MILTTADLRDRGIDSAEARRRMRARTLFRIARGRYSEQDPRTLTAEDHHRQLIAAILATLEDPVLSHATAGVLHELWVPARMLNRVHLTRPVAKASIGRRVHIHPRVGDPGVVSMRVGDCDPVAVTDLATTTIALLRMLPLHEGVAIADSALRQELDRDQTIELLDGMRGWLGVRQAKIALRFADRLSESAGESRSRWLMHGDGVPAPVLQQNFFTDDGEWIGRGDFWWPDRRLIGEFDGRVKYGRLLKPGQDVSEVIVAEREREVALINLGNAMTRWTWQTVEKPGALAKQVTRARQQQA